MSKTLKSDNPAIVFVDKILMEIPMIPEEAVKRAIADIDKVDSTYGLLWGDLRPSSRRHDELDLKFFRVKKRVLQLILEFMNDEKTWPLIVIASTGMRQKEGGESK